MSRRNALPQSGMADLARRSQIDLNGTVMRRTSSANTLLAVHGMIAGLILETAWVDAQIKGLRERLIGLVKTVLGAGSPISDPFPVERQLSELGVSSLKMVNLMLAVEVEFDVAIPQADITPENFHSILAIEALVARTLATR